MRPEDRPGVPSSRSLRVIVAGGTGYIGRHAVRELVRRGHQVVCLVRPRAIDAREHLAPAEVRFSEVTDAASLRDAGFRGERFDAAVSCLASRSGGIEDSWRVDHRANLNLLEASRGSGVGHFVLLSAICVQRPLLEFQRAKLAFERALVESGLHYSIVRPTAFFKSLSGQVEAVKRGKPFLVFGDGELTACKPISEADLARFLAGCLEDPARRDAILPVGGPGPAITPRQQGELLFELTGQRPRFRRVPVRLFDLAAAVLGALGHLVPPLRDKAEFARIGRYYATESMLLLDPATGRYDAEATPSYGQETLRDFYRRVLREGLAGQELGEQALFERK